MVGAPLDSGVFSVARVPALTVAPGALAALPARLAAAGWCRAALITGGRSLRAREEWTVLGEALLDAGVEFREFTVRGEPSPDVVDAIVAELRRNVPELSVVVGIGGGSVIDAAKAVAAGMRSEGSIADYLEGVGTRNPSGETVPCVALPTTAGTGSEATKNAVLSRIGVDGFKKSLRHDNFVPVWAIIDPQLHRGCPLEVTISSGLDAVSQLLESYLSSGSTPFTDALTLQGLSYAGWALPQLSGGADEQSLRSAMAYAAYLSGIGLANAGLGAIHGLASPIGAAVEIPHGVVCGRLIGPTMRLTIERLRRDPQAARGRSAEQLWIKLSRASAAIRGREPDIALDALGSAADQLAEWLEEMGARLPGFGGYGLDAGSLERYALEGGIKNHPTTLDPSELVAAMRAAW